MKKRLSYAIWMFTLLLVLSSCSGAGNTPTTPESASASIAVSSSASTVAILIAMENFEFVPDVITIKVGDTVEWKNNDNAGHDVVFDAFKSEIFSKGGTYRHTFNTAGSFSYICGVHPAMKGTVEVK